MADPAQRKASPLKRILLSAGVLGLVVGVFIGLEFLYIRYNGAVVPVPVTPRAPVHFGNGKALSYVVLGDSTAVTQGADYKLGYAYKSVELLAESHAVTFVNVAVSGARAADVAEHQVFQAVRYKPDIALVAVSANDVTGLTSLGSVERSMRMTVAALRKANPSVRIVVTGAPAMGAIPRLPWPIRQIMGLRTGEMNKMFERLAMNEKLIFAHIADRTGAAFAADPTLFAADKFHPNARGYALWVPVINEAVEQALDAQ